MVRLPTLVALARKLRRLTTCRRTVARRRTSPSGKTVIVHAGFRKTGTTTIQTLLENNCHLLSAEFGVMTRRTVPATNPLHHAGRDYSKRPGKQTAAAVKYAARVIDAKIRAMPQPVVLVSDENIIGLSIVSPRGDFFDVAADVLSLIEDELSGHQLIFVFSTRQREKWLRSCHNQDVKVHKFTGDYSEWLAVNGVCRNWEEGRSVIEAALNNPVIFQSMEADMAEDRFLGASLLELAGLRQEQLESLRQPSPQNASLKPVELEFMREINKLDLPFRVTHRIGEVVQRRPDLFRDGSATTEAAASQTKVLSGKPRS